MDRSRLARRITTTAALVRLLPVYVGFAVLKHVVPLRTLVRLAWRRPRSSGGDDATRTVARVAKLRKILRLPDRDCLQQSLVLYRELAAAAADPILVVGFRQEPDGLKGHAWVEAGGRVFDASADAAPFVPVCSFGQNGRVISSPLTPRTT